MVNKIWIFLIIIGILISIATGNIGNVNVTIIESGKQSLEIIFQMLPIMALWLGIMEIASKSLLLNKLTRLLNPILKKIFPEIPANHESLGYISSNIVANMFGLSNAATPFGLKAMSSLQELNNSKEASKSMITFLMLNTSGLTIIPTTIISMRLLHNSINPTIIVLPIIISTLISTIVSIYIDKMYRRKK